MTGPMTGRRRPLRLGTRRSALALAQAGAVADALRARGWPVELVEVTTHGDVSGAALADLGGTGVFVGALREALLAGTVDVAVHSLKDLPTRPVEGPAGGSGDGLVLAAVPPREDPRDVLVGRGGATLTDLPPGARLGTGSPRRAAQLRALGLGLDVVPVRGNVDTRLRLVAEGHLDGVVLARAGLARLGRLDVVSETFAPTQLLPAPGQGALALECRAGNGGPDPEIRQLLGDLDDAPTRAAVTAERALLAALEAGCTAPVGALAEPAEGEHGPELYLRAAVVAVDGAASVRLSTTGSLDEAASTGHRLAAALLADGAASLMGERVP